MSAKLDYTKITYAAETAKSNLFRLSKLKSGLAAIELEGGTNGHFAGGNGNTNGYPGCYR